VWGMAVMTDPVGNSNVDDAHMIAVTSDPHRGLRTWNANFIAAAPTDVARLTGAVEDVLALAEEWESMGLRKISIEFAACQIRLAIESALGESQ
jgi:hypothetical protein